MTVFMYQTIPWLDTVTSWGLLVPEKLQHNQFEVQEESIHRFAKQDSVTLFTVEAHIWSCYVNH